MPSSSSRSSSRIYIDMTDEDENICSNSEAELLAKCRKEVSELRTQVHVLQEENSALKSKLASTKSLLSATESELGKAVVANKMQVNYSTTQEDVGPAVSSKRPRSPSFEPVHTTPCIGKGKAKEEIMYSPVQLKKMKIEQISPAQRRMCSPTMPIIPKVECSGITRSCMNLKQPGTDRLSTSSDASSQPDVKPRSSAAEVTRPNQNVSASPLIAGPRKSARFTIARQEKLVTHGEHNSNLLRKSLKKYLELAAPALVSPRTPKARVKRVPFAKHYGGSDQHFLQYIRPERNPSGDIKRNLVFPQPQHNPFLPKAPGEPGLIFASRHEVANGSPWSLFVKPDPSIAIWTYLGDYRGEICGELTPDQFKMLSKTEQETWINRLFTQKSGVYFKMRIRIALRKEGLIPLDDKAAEEKLIEEWKSRESDFQVTQEDVRTALYEGQEVIDLILMTCISYDHVFANDIRRIFTQLGIRRSDSSEVGNDSSEVKSDSSDDMYVPE